MEGMVFGLKSIRTIDQGSHVSAGIEYTRYIFDKTFPLSNHHIYTASRDPSKPHYSGTRPHHSQQNLP